MILKTLENIKSAKLKKNRVKVNGDGRDEFNSKNELDSRDKYDDNEVGDNEVNDNKVLKKKNH